LKIIENVAVVICVAASVMISIYAKDANFVLVFSLFSVSALILAVTTYLKKDYAICLLQVFFVAVNTFALVKELF